MSKTRDEKIVTRISSESKKDVLVYGTKLGISTSQMIREGLDLRIKSAKASFS